MAQRKQGLQLALESLESRLALAGTVTKVQTDIANSEDWANDVAIQQDGKIVVVGTSRLGIQLDFAVVRYNRDLTLDQSFGTNGRARTTVGDGNDVGRSVAIQSDGKILVAGQLSFGSLGSFGVVRYNSNGTLDTSFDGDGRVIVDLGWGGVNPKVAIQPDGRIVVAGMLNGGVPNADIAVVRLLPNGSFDSSFDGDGKVTFDHAGYSPPYDSFLDLALQSDGEIVVAALINGQWATHRFLSNGQLDTSFSGDGIDLLTVGTGPSEVVAVEIQPSGEIVLVGNATNDGQVDVALARYRTNGVLDTTFGTGGTVFRQMRSADDRARGADVDSQGRIVVFGYSYSAPGLEFNDYAILRFLSDGAIDMSFGDGGMVFVDINNVSYDVGWNGLVEPNGGVVAIGYTGLSNEPQNFAVTRFLNDPPPQISIVNDQSINEGSPLTIPDMVTFTDLGGGPYSYEIGWGDGSSLDVGSVTTSTLPPGAIAGPITNPATGNVYYLFDATSWTEAESRAVALGGHLATINNTAENAWIGTTFANWGGVPRNLWIGLNDAAVEGTFVWTSGEPVSYLNWSPGEPNDLWQPYFGGGEDYVHLWGPEDGVIPERPLHAWNDIPNPGPPLDAPGMNLYLYGVAEVRPQDLTEEARTERGSVSGAHTFSDDGTFTVTVRVIDGNGGMATESFQVNVANAGRITIETVPVGNPGNPPDDVTTISGQSGFGAVSYSFRIGKFEVTNAQYAAFLNAIAATDTYELLTPGGADVAQFGIVRTGVSGSFQYAVKSGMANKPVTYMSFWNAARFANWLHNGQPTGSQNASTTEDGAYTLNGYTGNDGSWVTRNSNAKWFIPTEDEWYKAAYHKNNGTTADYWSYPTQYDMQPDSDQPPGLDAPTSANTANIGRDDGLANGYNDGYAVTGSPNSNIHTEVLLTDVGAYSSASGAYGTFDQAGNVWEWIESIQNPPGRARAMRGGGYSDGLNDTTASSFQSGASPDDKFHSAHGFRIATVAELSPPQLTVIGDSPYVDWTRQLGSTASEQSYSVAADGLGNVYISGNTDGPLVGPSAGSSDAFVSKYDVSGTLQWTRQFGTSAGDLSHGVSADGLGNIYISGQTGGSLGGPNAGGRDAFVNKYDASGVLQWTRQFGTSADDVSLGVSADGLGNVYISGYTLGSLGGPNVGLPDAFVSKFDASGTLQWSRQFGTSADDTSFGVSADGLGNVYISGRTFGSLGGPNAGGNDAFVAKYDASGTLQWSRQLGTSADDISNGVSADGLGNVYIAGGTSGSLGGPNAGGQDAFVSKYDVSGTLQWTRQLGKNVESGQDVSWGVSADGLGNVYIAGGTSGSLGGPNAGDLDSFVSKYDSAGTLQWSRQPGTSSVDISTSVSADGLSVYISGYTHGSLGGPNVGENDAFVVRLVNVSSAPATTEGAQLVITDLGVFSDTDSGNYPYQVNWGDGTPADTGLATIDVPGGGGELVHGSFDGSHTYADDGTFTVQATVTDPFGLSTTKSFQVRVSNVAPTVDAGPDATLVAGSTATHFGSFFDPGDDTWTAVVDYGDGAGYVPLSLTSDKHFTLNLHYTTPGTRTVRVTVTDDDGSTLR